MTQKKKDLLDRGLEYLETELSELSSPSAKRNLSIKRQMLMVFLEERGMHIEEVTGLFNRHRTTFYPSRKTVNNLVFSDPQVRETFEGLNRLEEEQILKIA